MADPGSDISRAYKPSPDAYRKLIDLTLWQRATDRNEVFDTNLIPEVVATPLSQCGVVWIITQGDTTTAHRSGSRSKRSSVG